VLLHQSSALFNGQLARNRGESAFMMWPGNHLRLFSTSPGRAFNVSPYMFIMLVAFVGLIAALTVATHWSCRIR
jgi:hypothetical protein